MHPIDVNVVHCRKRRSLSGTRPEDFAGEWSDVETRCSVAIEGHAAAKYVQFTHDAYLMYSLCITVTLSCTSDLNILTIISFITLSNISHRAAEINN